MADLNDADQFALCVALGVANIIKPLLEFLAGRAGATTLPSPFLDAALAVILVALPFSYLVGIFLLQLQLALPPAPAPARRFACLACTMVSALLVALVVPLVAVWLLAGGSSPPGREKLPFS